MDGVADRVTTEQGLPTDAWLEGLPDATVVVDTSGDVVWMNAAAEHQLGRPRESMTGRSGLDLIHPDDLATAAFSLVSVQSKRVGTPVEVRIRTEHGWRLAEVTGAPVEGGRIVLTFRDLTERRRWEVAGRDDVGRLRAMVEYAPTLFFLLDAHGQVQSSSGSVSRTLGFEQELVEGGPLGCIIEPLDRPRFDTTMSVAVSTAGTASAPHRVEVRLRDEHRRRWVPYELSILNLLEDPAVGAIIVTGHDVSERVAAEEEQAEVVSLLKATLDATEDGILVVDLDGRITTCNRRFAEMWCIPRERALRGNHWRAIKHVADQFADPESFLSRVRDISADREADSFDLLTFLDGRIFERTSIPQRVDGATVGRVWSFRDTTRQRQLEAELAHQAFHDALTGLSNQALFRNRVDHAAARAERDDRAIAVLYFDVDDFKRVNDGLGHAAGDQLLVGVAERLRACVREVDTTARLGGDEFAVLIDDVVDEPAIVEVAERVVATIGLPMRVAGRDIVPSISLGVAFSGPGIDAEQLMRNADLAMYAAKRRGKGTHELFVPAMHARALARLEIEAELRQALERNEFGLVYQPIVELGTGRTVGAEALLRWHHPQLGRLDAGVFVEVAEELGLMPEIGREVVRAACAQAREWATIDSGSPFTVSVNVSACQLTKRSIVDQVADELRRSGLDPRRLVIELTETAMLEDTEAAVAALRELKEMGVRLALDDFGTGFSSLTHLQQLPIDILKIDRSFMTTRSEDATLVRGVIRIARELDVLAIAEGVETEGHVRFLREVGCQYAQGFLLSHPATAAEITAMLLEQRVLGCPVTAAG